MQNFPVPSDPFDRIDIQSESHPASTHLEEDLLRLPKATLQEALEAVKGGDFSAAFELPVLTALCQLRNGDAAAYQRARVAFKQADKRISLTELAKAMPRAFSLSETSTAVAQTHNGYAANILYRFTVNGHRPVAHGGTLYAVDPDTSLWMGQDFGGLVRTVAEFHDDKANCVKSSDYSGIAKHAILLADAPDFFHDAPVGLACPDGFYRVDGGGVSVEPLLPAHRQRFQVDVIPADTPTPLFDNFLKETFATDTEGEEAAQRDLVQEIAGAMMLGLMPRHQKAVLFYDPLGRAGKGTLDKILQGLMPPSYITAVTPFRWDEEYYVMALARSRLNVVGELPNGKPLPSAAFKSVIGGDLVTGRHPTEKPVTFKNEATHIFMSNFLIGTTDQSEAFFARWLIVEFPNSRTKSGARLNPHLHEEILSSELPGIAYWALGGARRLLKNGTFTTSSAHHRLMTKWRRSTNSLEEFIHECCHLDSKVHEKRAELYRHYKAWCGGAGRKPYGKSTAYELLQNNVNMRITLASLHGHDIFRGVKVKDEASGNYVDDSNF